MPPSPKAQDQPVGEPVEESVKLTASGAWPLPGLVMKLATGGGLGVVTVKTGLILEVPAMADTMKAKDPTGRLALRVI